MISLARGRCQDVLRAAAPLAIVAAVCGVLLRFPPAQNGFYPRCPVYESLHLRCPGCGSTRALAALLHGNFTEAIQLNGLTTLLVPIGAIYVLSWYFRFVRHDVDHWPQVPHVAIYAVLAVAILFTVARNLPLGQ
jgi:Protein of unknown function (DUF2752)